VSSSSLKLIQLRYVTGIQLPMFIWSDQLIFCRIWDLCCRTCLFSEKNISC